jgi:hypothetical protein
MSGTLLFVHGTGVRDVAPSLASIRQGAKDVLGWGADRVLAVEWGKAVGPQPLDVGPVLPPESTRAALGEDAAEAAVEAARWDLLLADPVLELRVLAEARQASGGGGGLGLDADLPSLVLTQRLGALAPDPAAIQAAGLRPSVVGKARDQLVRDTTVARAADAVGDPDDGELVSAAARAVVALALLAEMDQDPLALYDSGARDTVVAAVEAELSPARGIGGDLVKKVVAPLATRFAVRKRAGFMLPLTNFIRDVAFYIQHGERIREFLAAALRQHADGRPLVVVAHSLGGIAAVDLLADPAVTGGGDPLPVDLLATVGSQAPYMYLMDALSSLSPRTPGDPAPFTPWLNVYNPEDLLSFCASRVFPNTSGITDEPVDAGVPFPMSHSAYWTQHRVYELLRAHMPQ